MIQVSFDEGLVAVQPLGAHNTVHLLCDLDRGGTGISRERKSERDVEHPLTSFPRLPHASKLCKTITECPSVNMDPRIPPTDLSERDQRPIDAFIAVEQNATYTLNETHKDAPVVSHSTTVLKVWYTCSSGSLRRADGALSSRPHIIIIIDSVQGDRVHPDRSERHQSLCTSRQARLLLPIAVRSRKD